MPFELGTLIANLELVLTSSEWRLSRLWTDRSGNYVSRVWMTFVKSSDETAVIQLVGKFSEGNFQFVRGYMERNGKVVATQEVISAI